MSTEAFEEYFRSFPHRFLPEMKTIGTFKEQSLSESSLSCASGAYLGDIWKWLCMISPRSWLLCITAGAALLWEPHSVQGLELLCVEHHQCCHTQLTGILFCRISRKCLTGGSGRGSVRAVLCSCAAWAALQEGGVSRVKIQLRCFNGNLRTWACS